MAQVPPGDDDKEGLSSSTASSSASFCCQCRTLPSVFPSCSSSMPPDPLPQYPPFYTNCCLQLLFGAPYYFFFLLWAAPSPAFPSLSTRSSLLLLCDHRAGQEQLWSALGRADAAQWGCLWMLVPADDPVIFSPVVHTLRCARACVAGDK